MVFFYTPGSVMQDWFVLEGGEGRGYASYRQHGSGGCDTSQEIARMEPMTF
jgi:hypothetical protein